MSRLTVFLRKLREPKPEPKPAPEPKPDRRRVDPEGIELQRYSTRTGRWWLPNIATDRVADAMKRGHIFDAHVVEEAARHIRPGSAVLDVGSNFGQMAVLFSRMTGPAGAVHAFEADPFVCRILRSNIEANGATNVIVHEAAVWHEGGNSLIYPKPDLVRWGGTLGSYGIDPKATEGRTVTSITIDSLCLSNVSFMKVDVQGSDLYAMMGARQTIARCQMPILFEFEESRQNEFGRFFCDYEALIDELNYRIEGRMNYHDYLIRPRSPAAIIPQAIQAPAAPAG